MGCQVRGTWKKNTAIFLTTKGSLFSSFYCMKLISCIPFIHRNKSVHRAKVKEKIHELIIIILWWKIINEKYTFGIVQRQSQTY